MPKSPPSGRASAKLSLIFGQVTVPVSIYSGTVSDHGITRKQFVAVTTKDEKGNETTEDHPVGSQSYDKVTNEVVEYQDIIKKIETEYGHVFVEDHEIENLFDLVTDALEIKAIQPQHLFHQGHYVPKSLSFVEPRKEKNVKQYAANQLALTLVLKTLKAEGAIAVCEYTTRGKPKPAILLPDGTLWEVYHTDALREQRELEDVEIHPDLLAKGKEFAKALWVDTPVDLTDERSALIQNFADEKAAAGDFDRPEAPAEQTKAPVASADLMALLSASVEVAKAKAAGE